MASIKLILWILVSNELCFSIIATSGQSDKKLKRASPYWTPTASAHGFSSPIRSSNYFATYRRQTDSDDGTWIIFWYILTLECAKGPIFIN